MVQRPDVAPLEDCTQRRCHPDRRRHRCVEFLIARRTLLLAPRRATGRRHLDRRVVGRVRPVFARGNVAYGDLVVEGFQAVLSCVRWEGREHVEMTAQRRRGGRRRVADVGEEVDLGVQHLSWESVE
ncbi:hypothetical protein B296_00033800 [Ensete ventricosum]|uniref:Uncharacterized protein n=1 Tax=Ensete ventricosum TaxID=4639 RepID=A0A426YX96_ENSVE|nr:hypothetical protein B296_00033800 [Ensete ventricosum]